MRSNKEGEDIEEEDKNRKRGRGNFYSLLTPPFLPPSLPPSLPRYAGSKIRMNGPRFLAYALVDSIVDELFPILR